MVTKLLSMFIIQKCNSNSVITMKIRIANSSDYDFCIAYRHVFLYNFQILRSLHIIALNGRFSIFVYLVIVFFLNIFRWK